MRDRLIELVNPFVSGSACGLESGSCEFTDCRTCNAQDLANRLIANGVTVQEWISVKDRLPNKYRDECGDLIPFLVCEVETEYPFRALFDGKTWGDGVFPINVTHWMPLPQPPKG